MHNLPTTTGLEPDLGLLLPWLPLSAEQTKDSYIGSRGAKQPAVRSNVPREGTFANPVEQGEIMLRFPTPLVPRSTDKEPHT